MHPRIDLANRLGLFCTDSDAEIEQAKRTGFTRRGLDAP